MKVAASPARKDVLGERCAWRMALSGAVFTRTMKTTSMLILTTLCCASFAEELRESGTKPAPPSQPRSGPGGADYAHGGIRETEHGEGGKQFWIIEPAKPAPKKAPVVIFLHGYSAMFPDSYRGWIDHLAKRGNIVIYPRYQEKLLTPPAEYFQNAIASVRAALAVLGEPGHVQPEIGRAHV